MSFLVDTSVRSEQAEIMDDFELSGVLLENTLDQIAAINRWLGGNRVTLNGVKKLLSNHPKEQELSIVDLGCGNGDMLRAVADFGRKNGFRFQLVGIDANQTTIDYAEELSQQYEEITYLKLDVLSDEFRTKHYDIALCTLFLHHFEGQSALDLVRAIMKNVQIGLVVNDLHRSAMAYYLFKTVTIFIRNEMVRTDGAISILRGFKRSDLIAFSNALPYKSSVQWKWAFRYQWIMKK